MDDDYHRVSGNIDARKVRELAASFGFSWNVIPGATEVRSLKLVKDSRTVVQRGARSLGNGC